MRGRVLVVVGLSCCVPSLGRAEPAASPSEQAALNLTRLPGAEDCPDVAELARRIGQHLGRDPFTSPAAASLMLDAVIEPVEPQGFRVHLTLTGADETPGLRELESPSRACNDALDSAALAIALMIDPAAVSRGATAKPVGTPKPVVAPAPTAVASPATKPAHALPPSSAWRARFSLGALGGIGQVPGTAFGVATAVREAPENGPLGVDVGFHYLAPSRAQLTAVSGAEISLSSLNAALSWRVLKQPFAAISLAAGFEVGIATAKPYKLESSHEVSSRSASAFLEGETTWTLSRRWQAFLRLTVGVPLWSDSFEVVASGVREPIFEPTPVFATACAGLALTP
jgi:hypothetical protein